MHEQEIEKFISNIKPEKEYNEYLRGKRVAIVGPSKHLLGSGHGPRIDDYDVVVRFKWHKLLPFGEWKGGKFVKDIGSKTNVIYGSGRLDGERLEEAEPFFKKGKLEYFRHADGKVSDEFNVKKLECGTTYVDFSAKHYAHALDRVAGKNSENFKIWPQCGFVGIMEIIASDCAEVLISGVTMYHGGGHIFQKNKPAWHNQPIIGKHNGVLELKLLMALITHPVINENKKVQSDFVLAYILKCYAKGKTTDEIASKINALVEKRTGHKV